MEIYMLYNDNVSMGYLIIEDLRRPLNESELQLLPFRTMDEEDIDDVKNTIKIDIVLDGDDYSSEERGIFEEFAMDLVDGKPHCAYLCKTHVNEKFFYERPVDPGPADYQKLLELVESGFNISDHIFDHEHLMHLSQD
ncbi:MULTISPECIES: hypothetical protein [Heyndrickxia]|nr:MULTISPECIES: hypothetical protein [Heyndrickxia]MEC2223584.1 hypothetical protein [Weizmannia sp. CD-2023]MED4890336.1 hypothetical protein [Weizmannia sp. CD-2023]